MRFPKELWRLLKQGLFRRHCLYYRPTTVPEHRVIKRGTRGNAVPSVKKPPGRMGMASHC